MSGYEKMHSGKIYDPTDREIMKEQLKCLDTLRLMWLQ